MGGRGGRQRGGALDLCDTPRAILATSTAVINNFVSTKEPLTNVKALASKWRANYIPDSNKSFPSSTNLSLICFRNDSESSRFKIAVKLSMILGYLSFH